MRYLLVLLALTTATAAAQLVPAKTKTVVFDPAKMQVLKTISGSCWTGSIASSRADAYRCMEGNTIHDPCFTLTPSEVACPVNATVNRGVRMTLTSPLPKGNTRGTGTAGNAWLITLASGATCNIGTGTVMPEYPFYCPGDMVCAAPAPQNTTGPVFVECGHPQGTGVTSAGRYLVTTMYK